MAEVGDGSVVESLLLSVGPKLILDSLQPPVIPAPGHPSSGLLGHCTHVAYTHTDTPKKASTFFGWCM